MSDKRPAGTYPAWDSEFRKQKAELKIELSDSLYEYPLPVRTAVLMELLQDHMNEYVRDHFEHLYESGKLDTHED